MALLKVTTTKFVLKSWHYFAAKTWNELPNKIRDMAGKKNFCEKYVWLNFKY